jgi:Flp pilus assembly protein TadG
VTTAPWRRARPEESRGAVLVEFALILVLLVALLVGIVSTAIAYNHQLALTHAAREGGRYAATLPLTNFGSVDDWLNAIAAQAVSDAGGTLAAAAPSRYICVAYVFDPGGPNDLTRRRVESGAAVSFDDAVCPSVSDGRPATEHRVQVRVARDANFTVVFFSTTVNLTSQAVTRFEPSA